MRRIFQTLLVSTAAICIAGNAFAITDGRHSSAGTMGIMTKIGPSTRGVERGTQLTPNETLGIQRELDKRGYAPGPIDGIFGPRTQKALREFQANNRLAVTGTPTEETLDKLSIDTNRPDEEHIYWSGPRVGGVRTGR